MSKTRIFALLLVAIMLGSILTNPSKEQVETAIKEKAKTILQQKLNYAHKDAMEMGMLLFGDKILKDFVDKNIQITNYYLFTLIRIKWQGDETPIGGGAFKKVWLSPKIDEKAEEIIGVLKNL
ncbi:hypothetical protein ACL9RF_14700 [Sphingobacterium sp. Mn56C]|uniref:hypothetical protein n=1 Tax=Sphingobacterium sp. Mn56C TaxID=3395261 RepID=UPI003BE30DCE